MPTENTKQLIEPVSVSIFISYHTQMYSTEHDFVGLM